MKDLLIEYRKTRLLVINKINQLEIVQGHEADDLLIYKDMLKDIDYIIEWLTTGHEPNNYNSIDKAQCYLVDHEVISKAFSESMYRKCSDVEYSDVINDLNHPVSHALMKLTQKELECFIMVKCEYLSLGETAELLNIQKATVQMYLNRAITKMKSELEGNLFLLKIV